MNHICGHCECISKLLTVWEITLFHIKDHIALCEGEVWVQELTLNWMASRFINILGGYSWRMLLYRQDWLIAVSFVSGILNGRMYWVGIVSGVLERVPVFVRDLALVRPSKLTGSPTVSRVVQPLCCQRVAAMG